MKPKTSDVRTKGQVWTPLWVAQAMATYVLQGNPQEIFEPSLGSGALVDGILAVASLNNLAPHILGNELHPEHLEDLQERVDATACTLSMTYADFLDRHDVRPIQSIVANPPYMRHHRFDEKQKDALQRIAEESIGVIPDRRTGYHTFFLLRALHRMIDGARGAFILPADVFEGISSKSILAGISRLCAIHAIATFSKEASPFPGVDTNPIVVFFQKGASTHELSWSHIKTTDHAFTQWVEASFPEQDTLSLYATKRTLSEALATGFSRPPHKTIEETVELGHFIRTSRGIATGDNEYFVLTSKQLVEHDLPREAFVRCIRRTRDLNGDVFLPERLEELDSKDQPTYLLYLQANEHDPTSVALDAYLEKGKTQGLGSRPFCMTRKPWYRMERREVPPILFSYLGRTGTRFIHNKADILPLNGFTCIYPKTDISIEHLLQLLNHPEIIEALAYEGKSYGDGAIKIEPNALERVRVPMRLLEELQIPLGVRQQSLF